MEREQKSRSDETGATAVEYGLLVALIAAVIVVVVAALGQKLIPGFDIVINGLP
jgi:pilus assembly protein Flp/PilA